MATTSSPLRDVRLYRMDLPDHACPWGLRALQLLQEQHIPFEDHPLRSEAEVAAFKAAHAVATTPQLFAGEKRIGGYADLAARLGVRPESADVSYTPVLAVFGTAALMTLTLSPGLGGFMGIALCLLAMLKLMDVQAFAASFRKYDLLSQRWGAWGGLYPGVELLVGLGILLQPPAAGAARLIGATALLLGAMGMVSVGKAVFVDKLALNCACVGGERQGAPGGGELCRKPADGSDGRGDARRRLKRSARGAPQVGSGVVSRPPGTAPQRSKQTPGAKAPGFAVAELLFMT